jgi:hypothetical protein
MDRLAWHDEMISLMKVGQLCGHSCFKIETRTRFSLFKKARSLRSFSSEPEFSMIKFTMKLRIPTREKGIVRKGFEGGPGERSLGVRFPSGTGKLTLALFPGQDLPTGHDHIVKNL